MANNTTPRGEPKDQDSRLRIASIDDILLICAIARDGSARFASIPQLVDLAEDEGSPSEIEQWLKLGRIYLVDEVGFIAAHPQDGVIYIAEISVLTSHQRKGIGAMLLNAVFEWAIDRSLKDGQSGRSSVFDNIP